MRKVRLVQRSCCSRYLLTDLKYCRENGLSRFARLLAVCAALLVTTAFFSAEARARTPLRPVSKQRTVLTTFNLHVMGKPAAHTTFWVAYGPLADHWGVIQLRASGHGLFTAQRFLPAVGRTIYVYLAGHDFVTTPLGSAPGIPIIAIRWVGPMSASRIGTVIVEWSVPIG
jgi:hypothetical protein